VTPLHVHVLSPTADLVTSITLPNPIAAHGALEEPIPSALAWHPTRKIFAWMNALGQAMLWADGKSISLSSTLVTAEDTKRIRPHVCWFGQSKEAQLVLTQANDSLAVYRLEGSGGNSFSRAVQSIKLKRPPGIVLGLGSIALLPGESNTTSTVPLNSILVTLPTQVALMGNRDDDAPTLVYAAPATTSIVQSICTSTMVQAGNQTVKPNLLVLCESGQLSMMTVTEGARIASVSSIKIGVGLLNRSLLKWSLCLIGGIGVGVCPGSGALHIVDFDGEDGATLELEGKRITSEVFNAIYKINALEVDPT
jgi:hypothetical protein